MQFDEHYFDSEVMDGFVVPSKIKRAWASQLEILSDVDRICEKYHITYFAEWGTLLGVVRHHGYIPWDDDMDIVMKRSDYHRFLEAADKELPANYHLNNFYREDGFTDYMTRIVNEHAINFTPSHLQKYHQFPYISGLDIFVLDALAPDEEKNARQVELIREIAGKIKELEQWQEAVAAGYRQMFSDSRKPEETGAVVEKYLSKEPFYLEKKAYIGALKEQYHLAIPENISLLRQFYIASDRIMALYSDEEKYPSPERVTLMPLWCNGGTYVFPAQYYAQTIRIPFETMQIPVPLFYDAILRRKYGDYWKLIRKGSSHAYPYFRVQEQIVQETKGTDAYLYLFSPDAYRKKEQKKRPGFVQKMEEYLGLFRKMNGIICSSLRPDTALQLKPLLAEAQELAVSFGSFLEMTLAEKNVMDTSGNRIMEKESSADAGNLPVVHLLEDYCELLYELSLLGEGGKNWEEAAEIFAEMDANMQLLTEECEKCRKRKKKILFLVTSPKDWDAFAPVYEQYLCAGNAEMHVAAIPYYRQLTDGTVLGPFLETRGYPSAISIETECPVRQLYFDRIYFGIPYDGCNPEKIIEKKYHSSELYPYTEKLIYIPSLQPADFDASDERSLLNMDTYVTMPGLVYADEVLLSSETIRRRYLEKLSSWAGSGTEDIWTNKLKVLPTVEKSSHKEAKKKLLFYMDRSVLWNEPERKMQKMKEVLETFTEYSSKIMILWCSEDMSLFPYSQETLHQYEQLKQQFQKSGLGKIYEMKDDRKDIEKADAYYGDPGWLSTKMAAAGKPVMIMNP